MEYYHLKKSKNNKPSVIRPKNKGLQKKSIRIQNAKQALLDLYL